MQIGELPLQAHPLIPAPPSLLPFSSQARPPMTMIRGVRLLAAPCCGARYSAPRYLSMNFSAWAYWTDGWRDSSLMPNDSGLRRCSCGQFILMKDLVELGTAGDSELPQIDRVPEEQLLECIKAVTNSAVAIAARLDYWRHLNHPYRIKYCAHRDAEEAATEAAWRAANPERKLPAGVSKRWARKAPQYVRPPNSPFTYPAFEPTAEQLENMAQLTVLLQAAKTNALPWGQELALAELLREQSRFDEARASLAALSNAPDESACKIIANMIEAQEPAPMRYRG